jgi:hypothetical protein
MPIAISRRPGLWLVALSLIAVAVTAASLASASAVATRSWNGAMSQVDALNGQYLKSKDLLAPVTYAPLLFPPSEERGGNLLHAWRTARFEGNDSCLVVRQERHWLYIETTFEATGSVVPLVQQWH